MGFPLEGMAGNEQVLSESGDRPALFGTLTSSNLHQGDLN